MSYGRGDVLESAGTGATVRDGAGTGTGTGESYASTVTSDSSCAEETRFDAEPARAGSLRFVSSEERALLLRRFQEEGRLVVNVAVVAAARGRLAEVLEEAVEHALAPHSAVAPGLGTAGDPEAQLSDQLFRARRVGKRGLVLALGSLRAAVGSRGVLDRDDSATLAFLADASRTRPLALLLDAADAEMGAFADPVPLAALLSLAARVIGEVGPTHAVVADAKAEDANASNAPAANAKAAAVMADFDPGLDDLTPEEAHDTEIPPEVVPLHTAGAAVAVEDDAWRSWLLALTAARGAQPLAAFEKLFTQSYLPLATALTRGLCDPRARIAVEEFRRTFARSYAEAVPTFALTGKRPRMVLDVPELAARIARLHGARSTQLVCVDSMRWDLGAMVARALTEKLGPRASLTEELNLFAALPSTTLRQLECIARGPDALRERTNEEADDTAARGRGAEVLRRMRVGSRDLFKLDLVESRLRVFEGGGDGGRATLNAFPDIAERVAEVIGKHAGSLAARTLLFVFGDHGFAVDASGATRQGGSSPEEVLVPAYAFLVGAVH